MGDIFKLDQVLDMQVSDKTPRPPAGAVARSFTIPVHNFSQFSRLILSFLFISSKYRMCSKMRNKRCWPQTSSTSELLSDYLSEPSENRCPSSSVSLHLPSSWFFDDAGRVVLSSSQSFEMILRRGACSYCCDNSEEKRADFHFWVQMSNCLESNWQIAVYIRPWKPDYWFESGAMNLSKEALFSRGLQFDVVCCSVGFGVTIKTWK